MSDHGTSILEMSDKGHFQTMTLKSTSTPQSNGGSFHVKDHPKDIISDGSIAVKKDNVKCTFEEKQDVDIDLSLANSNDVDLSVDKDCVARKTVNGLSDDLLTQAPNTEEIQIDSVVINSNGIELSKCDEHLSSSSISVPSPQSQTNCLSAKDETSEKACDSHQPSESNPATERKGELSSPVSVNHTTDDNSTDTICEVKAQHTSSETSHKDCQSDGITTITDGDIPTSPVSPSLSKEKDINIESKSDQTSASSVDEALLLSESESEPLPNTSPPHTPVHPTPTIENDVEHLPVGDSLSNPIVSPSSNKKSTVEDDVALVPEENNTVADDAMDVDTAEAEQEVVCQDLSDVSSKNKVGSRISVLEYCPSVLSSSGLIKNSASIHHTSSPEIEKEDDVSTISGEIAAESMEVEEVVNKVQEPTPSGGGGGDLNLCSSDSHMEEGLTNGVTAGNGCEEMDLQDDGLLDAEESVENDEEKDNSVGILVDEGGDSTIQSLVSVEGAKNVDSPKKNECGASSEDDIRLVSVCSMVNADESAGTSDGAVVIADDVGVLNTDEGKVNTDVDNVKADNENVNTDGANVDTDDGKVNTDVENVKADDENVNTDVAGVNTAGGKGNTDDGCVVNIDDGNVHTNTDDASVVNSKDGSVDTDDGKSNADDGCAINIDDGDGSNTNDPCIVNTDGKNEITENGSVVNANDENISTDDGNVLDGSDGDAVDVLQSDKMTSQSKSSESKISTEKESVTVKGQNSSCDAGKSRDNSDDCLFEELEGDAISAECDEATREIIGDVIKMDTDDDDVVIDGEEKLNNGKLNDEDMKSESDQKPTVLKATKTEVKDCSMVEDVKMKDDQAKNVKSEDLKLNESNCTPIEIKDDVKDLKIIESESSTEYDAKKMSFKNILKSKQDTRETKEETKGSNILADEDVIILDEQDEDLNSESNTPHPPEKGGNQNNNNNSNSSSITISSTNNSSNSAEISHKAGDAARKRSISSNDIVNPPSPKRSRIDLETDKGEKSTDSSSKASNEDVDVDILTADGSSKDSNVDVLTSKEESKMTLTSKMLRNFIMSSLKAAIWSHKLEKTVELEERMSKMEAASSLWKESGKHLENSVEELTKFSKEIEKRKAQSQKLKHLSSRSVGVQVTPINPDNRSHHPLARQMIQQQVRQVGQPSMSTRQPPTSSTTAPTSSTQQHRLPPSVLLNHGGVNQKALPVSPTSSTAAHSANKGRQPTRPPQHQQQQVVRPPGGAPATFYSPSGPDQNQARARLVGAQHSPQNPPPQYGNNSNVRTHPSGANQSPNTIPRAGRPHQPPPTVNLGGVIDLTDEDDAMAKKPLPSSNKNFNGNAPPGNNMNRSTVNATVYRGGNKTTPSSPQQQNPYLRPQQPGVAASNNRVQSQQQQQQRNMAAPGSASQMGSNNNSRSGYLNNNTARPGGNVSVGLTGVRIQGPGGSNSRQVVNLADGSRVTSSGIQTLPPSHSLHNVNNKHPAPFPNEPNSIVAPNTAKLRPPKPSLKISRVVKGIVLSWNMPPLNNIEVIASYQLYAYQESSGTPSSSAWKKVGDVKALPLPMACTLTQFQEGNKYYFAVRAVDQYGRWGDYSDPSSIHLYPDSTTGGRES